jgi:anti-anti-sigma regulatory factor
VSSPSVHLPPKVEQRGNVRVLTFTADGARDVENLVARDLEGRTGELGEGHLLLDFTNDEYLRHVELGRLVTLHKRMKACGGRLTLFNLNARVYEIFAATRLQTLLGICREGTTKPSGSGYTTVIKKKVNGTEKTGTAFPGDPDKFVDSE